jgi:hypothetical protein
MRLNEMGFGADGIERLLAHDEPKAERRTYMEAERFDNRRLRMQQRADYQCAVKTEYKVRRKLDSG